MSYRIFTLSKRMVLLEINRERRRQNRHMLRQRKFKSDIRKNVFYKNCDQIPQHFPERLWNLHPERCSRFKVSNTVVD